MYGCWCPAIPALSEVCPCQHLQTYTKYGFTDKTARNHFWAASRAVRTCSTEITVLCILYGLTGIWWLEINCVCGNVLKPARICQFSKTLFLPMGRYILPVYSSSKYYERALILLNNYLTTIGLLSVGSPL